MAAFGFEHIFDRIFEGEDVVLAIAVDEIDEGCERGRLAGADRSGDEHEAVLIAGERQDVFEWQADVFDRADVAVDDAKHHVIAKALLDDRGAVTTAGRRIGEVDVAAFFETGPFGFRKERAREFFGLFRGQRIMVFPDGRECAKAPPGRWVASGEVNIRAVVFTADLEVLVNVFEDLMGGHGACWKGLGCSRCRDGLPGWKRVRWRCVGSAIFSMHHRARSSIRGGQWSR